MNKHAIQITARCSYKGRNGRCQRKTTITHPYCAQHTRMVLGVSVRKSQIPNAGLGLFAEKSFKTGDYVAQYSGEIISVEEYDKRYSDDAMGSYGVELDSKRVIDACRSDSGVARYACDYHGSGKKPNVEYVADDEKDEVWLVAIRPIKKGDEILSDYGDDMHRAMGI